MEAELGKRLKALREAAGLTQAELATAAGVPVGSLRNWEHGRREPLLSAAGQLAKALGVDVGALLPEQGEATPAPEPEAIRKAREVAARVKAEARESSPRELLRQVLEAAGALVESMPEQPASTEATKPKRGRPAKQVVAPQVGEQPATEEKPKKTRRKKGGEV